MEDSPANSTGEPVNTTNPTAVSDEVLLVFSSLLIFLAFISLIGNIISVVAICRVNILHKPVFVFAANIACADILQDLFSVPYTAACLVVKPTESLFGPLICSVQSHIAYSTISTIICFLAITAVYRMMQVCYNSTYSRINRTRWMVPLSVTAWTVPVVLLVLFSGKAEYNPRRYGCYFKTFPLMTVLPGVLYVPMCVLLLVSYVKVLVYVWKCKKRIQVQLTATEETKSIKKMLMIYKPVIIIFVIFLAMFAIPGTLYQMAKTRGQTHAPMLELVASIFTKMRPAFNMACNIVTSSYFRNAVWENVHLKCSRT